MSSIFLSLSPQLLLVVANVVLWVCALVLFIVFVVRFIMWSRTGDKPSIRMNDAQTILLIVGGIVSVCGNVTFGMVGITTYRPLLKLLGGMCVALFLIYVLITALRRLP